MIGLDTNVLVRYFMDDNEDQGRVATQMIEALTEDDPGFITTVGLVELVWVLRRNYRIPQEEILPLIDNMMRTKEFRLQDSDAVRQAMRAASDSSADFADGLISVLGLAAGCETTYTLDRAASELAGMTLLER